MSLRLWSASARARSLPVLAAAVVIAKTILVALNAQTSSQYEGPLCVAPPAFKENDTWPVAALHDLGSTPSPQPIAFTSALLLANDRPLNAVTLVSVASTSTENGKITGASPYLYTPPARFAGVDTFSYQIADAAGKTSIGIVTVTVVDVTPPTVTITAPAAGTVSGAVTITATAADNVGVAGVTLFDGATQIGTEDLKSPFSATWDSTHTTNGTHNLTAVARDQAGNRATSAPVVVNVVNTVTTSPAGTN
jgi:Big-like domain-containing protein